jgi:hypothetical protein
MQVHPGLTGGSGTTSTGAPIISGVPANVHLSPTPSTMTLLLSIISQSLSGWVIIQALKSL